MKTRAQLLVGFALLLALLVPATAAAAKKVSGDHNRNGISDRWEKKYGLIKSSKSNKKIAHNSAVRVAAADTDHDGLVNKEEFDGRTVPTDSDTDGDGISDGDENGVVASFNGSYLRVVLPGGHRMQGVVDEDTLVFCEPEETSNVVGEDDEEDTSDVVGDEDGDISDDQTEDSESDPLSPDYDLGLCGHENITVGAEVVYSDEDDGFFSDVTLNVEPASAE